VIDDVDEWRVFFTRRGLPMPRTADPLLEVFGDLDEWLDEHDVLERAPFLIDPLGRYDVDLNRYFRTTMSVEPANTQAAAAYDLKKFLAFLWEGRGRRSWKDATEEDRAAYKQWRLVDPRGPRVELTTWDREVATVNAFYRWAVRQKFAQRNPFVQRESRSQDVRGRGRGETPAEASHQGSANRVEWFPASDYRRWRDVGVRGFTVTGLPDASFRGRLGARNATYADLMIRTGLRLSEQTSLSMFELPEVRPRTAFARTWLPHAIAKGGSARHIYIPNSGLKDVWDYVEMERAEAVERAQAAGAYEQIRDPLVVSDRARPYVVIGGERVNVSKLDDLERCRLLVETADGLEPAALWLNEFGLPSDPDGWTEVFKNANKRCARLDVELRAHAHLLRHSFAVITLEQLQRGHIKELAEMNPAQRRTYQMVFGDPLNWVRMRLGHKSITTTQIYLHTLQELEMETRMALIPDDWEPVGVHPEDLDEQAVAEAHDG